MSAYAAAPQAPGAMGQDAPAEQILAYLDALGTWRDRRRVELDQLDEASLRSADGQAHTGDIILSMALWKSIADRHDLLVNTWDNGRVLEAERRRIITLIWGRLDTVSSANASVDAAGGAGGALSVSLPEACRLSDTLAASLRAALRIDGTEPDTVNRVHELRAQVERVRDQVQLIPSENRGSAQAALIDLDRRVVDITERAKRGADVGGLLGPIEAALATTERDLIVAASNRAKAKNDHQHAAQVRAELEARGEAVRGLAAYAQQQVRPVPHLGIPDVNALGDVPTDLTQLEAYLAKLDRVGAALDQVHTAYASALDRKNELEGLARSYAAEGAQVTDVPGASDDLAALMALVEKTAAEQPTDTDRLAALAAAVQAYTSALRKRGRR
ncbi:MAG: hypothetical protein Q4G51_03335 [Dermatophilus congolensis]|nr:hypothetical protein [Dermatophilus congolensis]